MEEAQPPFSAREVASMSLETSAGKATVKQACEVFGISRAAYYEAQKNKQTPPQLSVVEGGLSSSCATRQGCASTAAVKVAISTIVHENPAWGVRKVWATLRRPAWELKVGHRRVHALMSSMGLCMPPDRSHRTIASRGHVVVEEPNRRFSTDLTTVWTKEDGVVAVVPVLDNGCRSALALGVTKSQESAAVLAPVRAALVDAFGSPENVPDGFELLSDHGPQYTGSDCQAFCEEWRVDHIFAPVGRPTGNAAVERFIRTMKEECIWLRDWTSAAELERELGLWLKKYNEGRPHQALKWQTPAERRADRLGPQRLAA